MQSNRLAIPGQRIKLRFLIKKQVVKHHIIEKIKS